jgi:LPXTG-site transpeptidase (sortase) family protein
MPAYRFEDREGRTGGEKTRQAVPASRKIPVEPGEVSFQIGRQEPKQVNTAHGKADHNPAGHPVRQPVKPALSAVRAGSTRPPHRPGAVKPASALAIRVWNGLEFVAVTAVIFMLLFFVINFDSYSRLLVSKLDQLRGTVSNNPYIAQQLEKIRNASPEGQQPLPIVSSSQAAKKQIPDLSLEIAPPDDRIIIPRIGQNVPIVRVPTDKLLMRDWTALENQIQEALRYGVVHFPGTALPGDKGNVVITGHSSYFPWDPGRFKDVFALLHQVDVGDRVIVYRDQKPYEYEVYDKEVVMPDQVEVLTQKGEDRLTLITCTPVGTNLKRLVLLAKPLP